MQKCPHTITLKESADDTISKHNRRIFKREAKVVEDKNPEDLHQMRVGMQKLRRAIALSPIVTEKILPRLVER